MTAAVDIQDAETVEDEGFEEEQPGAELATIEDDPEVIEGELVSEPEPLTPGQAKVLDKRIRQASDRVTNHFNSLLELLEQAAQGNIHEALGFKSWTAWLKDAVQLEVSDRFERQAMAKLLSGKGASQRTIAGMLGVSQKTIDRDLEGESDDSAEEPAEVTGLDGKTYKKEKPKPKAPKAEEPEAEEPEAKSTPIGEDYRDEIYNLMNTVAAIREIVMEDDRFPKARTRLAKAKVTNDFRDAINELDELLAIVQGEEAEGE